MYRKFKGRRLRNFEKIFRDWWLNPQKLSPFEEAKVSANLWF